MDKELLYNQSGIKDNTAYKAITNLQCGGAVDMNGTEINKGEIWEVEAAVGTRYVVVLNCFERYAATIMLQDQEPTSNAVSVIAHGIMYADAGRPGFVFYDKFISFIRALKIDEDAGLRQAIAAALELEDADAKLIAEELIVEQRKALEKAQEEVESLRKQLEEAPAAATGYTELVEESGIREELAAVRKEAEIYKGLYEDMLTRALG